MALQFLRVNERLKKCLSIYLKEKPNSYSANFYSGIWSIEGNLSFTIIYVKNCRIAIV